MMDKRNILIVDDDRNVRVLLKHVAQLKGAMVTTAETGKQALSIMASKRFDVIILDLMMPDGCGWEVLFDIRHDEMSANTPVIILSGTAISKSEKRTLTDCDTLFMDKRSFKPAKFAVMLESLLAECAESPLSYAKAC